MKAYPIAELVLDFDFYPRAKVDSQHVGEMVEAMKAKTELPPIVICKKSRRIVDGFHRYRATQRVHGNNCEIMCIEKSYRSQKELFLDAVRYNAHHGRNLSSYDRSHVILLADKLKIPTGDIAVVLNYRIEKVDEVRLSKRAKVNGGEVAIKRTIGHKAGQKLSKTQREANKKLGGMNQLFYVNQLIILLENDLFDRENEDLVEAAGRLRDLLSKF